MQYVNKSALQIDLIPMKRSTSHKAFTSSITGGNITIFIKM